MKIATLDQTTGDLDLLNNATTDEVLNAVGYKAGHANIADEFSAWIGFVAQNNCGLAMQVTEAPFLASWQRPINLDETTVQPAIDAKDNGNYIYLVDILKFFDWRGPEVGEMNSAAHRWYWAFYGINAITVDVSTDKVYTDMHNGNLNSTTLNSITTDARLYTEGATGGLAANVSHTFRFGTVISPYGRADRSQDLYDYMTTAANKAQFGYIYYENNGDNVTNFSVRVPVTVSYTWGDFRTYVTINIDRTRGN